MSLKSESRIHLLCVAYLYMFASDWSNKRQYETPIPHLNQSNIVRLSFVQIFQRCSNQLQLSHCSERTGPVATVLERETVFRTSRALTHIISTTHPTTHPPTRPPTRPPARRGAANTWSSKLSPTEIKSTSTDTISQGNNFRSVCLKRHLRSLNFPTFRLIIRLNWVGQEARISWSWSTWRRHEGTQISLRDIIIEG